MKKLKIIAAALCLLGQSALAQFPATVTDIGQGGTFSNNNTTNINNVCINQTSKDIKFVPNCPGGAGISNATTTTTFSALGGAQINSQTTAGTATFQMKSTPVPGFTENRYPTGRIYADYKCSYDSTYVVSYCGSTPVTTTVRLSRIGRSHIDFFQIFTWNRPIVGPDCVKNGEEVTYSIFDYLSGPIDNQDVYTWTYPATWSVLYYS